VRGLKNVIVSNGYLNRGPSKELLPFIDAANIDLKSFNPDFYQNEIGGNLEKVLDFIAFAAGKIHIEVTTLVIPGKNDTKEEISQIARYLAEIDTEIPYHLSAYYPTYKYDLPRTSPELLTELRENAQQYLKFVYLGNIRDEVNTNCPDCGNLLINRRGYHTRVLGIDESKCERCGLSIPVIGV
jgi:pyruvate formate lyase activating enzyme